MKSSKGSPRSLRGLTGGEDRSVLSAREKELALTEEEPEIFKRARE
jgi:hypothetical protein